MTPPINDIICGHNVDILAAFPDECIDLTVTSPPYDNLRKYKGYTFDFEGLAQQLYRVTGRGGVVVWIVADATIDGSETCTSFKQALYFREIGFNLHDTMIYGKENYVPLTHNRYEQAWEYMFVFSKGKPKTFNPLTIRAKDAGRRQYRGTSWGIEPSKISMRERNEYTTTKSEKIKPNIWTYLVGNNLSTKDDHTHAAPFPERLAADHILSWSNPDDIVLDPMCGSGTTLKMAATHGRHYIGIDCAAEYCDLSRRRVSTIQPVLL